LTFDIALSILALFTNMILQGKTASSCPILATTFTKKEIVQTSWTIIIPNVIRVGFCTGLFVPSEIETEIFSALMAELKEVLIQSGTADLTVADLHLAYNPSHPPFTRKEEINHSPFYKRGQRGITNPIQLRTRGTPACR
jgi:hypothetical protein